MTQFFKHIGKEMAMPLRKQVDHRTGQIVSKVLIQNEHVELLLYALDKEERIATFKSKGDTFLYIIDGTSEVTIAGETNIVTAGEVIVIPAHRQYSVLALESFKMLHLGVFG